MEGSVSNYHSHEPSVSEFVNLSGAIPWSVAAHLSGEQSWLAAACLALEFRYQASCGLEEALFCFAFQDLLLSKAILSAGFSKPFQCGILPSSLSGVSLLQQRCQNLGLANLRVPQNPPNVISLSKYFHYPQAVDSFMDSHKSVAQKVFLLFLKIISSIPT